MSGRIRTIKPEILEDAVTAGLSDMAFRIFVSAIVLADDYGRLRAEPAWLMGQIYWSRTVSVEAFLVALDELAPVIRFYVVNGQRYAEIRSWSKHQKVSHPGKPRIPAPPEVVGEPRESFAKPSGESRETLVPDLRSPTNDQRPARGSGGEPSASPPVAAAAAPPDTAPVVEDEKPKSKPKSPPKRLPRTALPADWQPSAELAAEVRAAGLDLHAVVVDFVGHWRGKGELGADWNARFRQNVDRILRTDWLLARFALPPEACPPLPHEAPVYGPPATGAEAAAMMAETFAMLDEVIEAQKPRALQGLETGEAAYR